MKRRRGLRRLVPDPALFRRRAAGETLRQLAADYGVSHTALGRFFARPEARSQLREAGRLLRAERQADAAAARKQRRLEQQLRRTAGGQARAERAQARHHRAVAAAIAARRRSRPSARSGHAYWLDDQDLRQPLSRADLYSRNDSTAAPIVATGGGIEALLEATGLRSRENLYGLIDPALLVGALDNDAKAKAAAQPDRARLRRLSPDPELVRRRAAGETLRALAADYQVAHTTLGRWFKRPQVASQLRAAKRHPPTPTTSHHRPKPATRN